MQRGPSKISGLNWKKKLPCFSQIPAIRALKNINSAPFVQLQPMEIKKHFRLQVNSPLRSPGEKSTRPERVKKNGVE